MQYLNSILDIILDYLTFFLDQVSCFMVLTTHLFKQVCQYFSTKLVIPATIPIPANTNYK